MVGLYHNLVTREIYLTNGLLKTGLKLATLSVRIFIFIISHLL